MGAELQPSRSQDKSAICNSAREAWLKTGLRVQAVSNLLLATIVVLVQWFAYYCAAA